MPCLKPKDAQLPFLPVAGEEGVEPVLQHAERETGAVDHIIRAVLDGGEQLDLPFDGLLDGIAGRGQRMRPAGLLVAPHQRAQLRVHVQDAHGAVHGLELLNGAQQLPEALALAYVGHEGDLLIAAAGVQAELGKARHELYGHVVHAVVFQILQHVRGAALARAGEPGDDEKFHIESPYWRP